MCPAGALRCASGHVWSYPWEERRRGGRYRGEQPVGSSDSGGRPISSTTVRKPARPLSRSTPWCSTSSGWPADTARLTALATCGWPPRRAPASASSSASKSQPAGAVVRWRRHPDHPHPGPDTRPRAALPCHPARPSGPYDETGSTAFCTSTCRSHDVAGSSAPTWADLGLGHPDDDGPSVHQAERAARAGYDCVRVLLASSRRCSHPLRRCSPVGGRTTHACGLPCFHRWSTDFARQRRDRICEGQETTSLTSGPALPQRLIHHDCGHGAAGFAPATGGLCPLTGLSTLGFDPTR
jgi:hypothetical protein